MMRFLNGLKSTKEVIEVNVKVVNIIDKMAIQISFLPLSTGSPMLKYCWIPIE